MQINIKYMLFLLFILQTSMAQIKDPIILNIDNTTTLNVDKNNKYNYVQIDTQEENNLLSKLTFDHINYDIRIQYDFEIVEELSSLDADIKYKEMDILLFISYSDCKYQELMEYQNNKNLPPILQGAFTFDNVIIKDSRDKNNIKLYRTINNNIQGYLNKRFD
ncbi:hypothetical protein HMPREF9714_02192 [Myroides odoratimimus CCUG 12901]|uniref:Uncharacterized protein n=2 Tax=Flavobacteriaceae TaxID=49546 RepID=A0ABN0EB53_9FLAO|nr:hypothetical protein [Myroides odoratimimus]EHO08169.1 hypothetical protein HMPREF9714_02192 [Myroides odoratimimus CCUG 12901]EHO10225.1 hypothetical protein HMPREF9712_01330 [Myroides odoratimimus CCUG 10230]MDM1066738.1 hypothetical protein [Myroides odoratimimus]MDM1096673.1 hypothetical protein [Myroides odoratimimus]MDM1460847.1 hypothetical protein [Myroides odoratimimus]